MAFCAPMTPLPTLRGNGRLSCTTRRVHALRRAHSPARMMADDGETPPNEESVSLTEGTTSASGILKILREESEEFVPGVSVPREKLGVTRDADGKSNVWPVMPRESVEQKEPVSKAMILAGAFGFIVLALLILPKLPFTNMDQF